MIPESNVLMQFPEGCEVIPVRAEDIPARLLMLRSVFATAPLTFSSEKEAPGADNEDNSLNDAAEDEREYVRRRLRQELGRAPSEEEVDEWLRRHTEGY